MKGINAMTAVMILLLIALSIFAWISTQQSVGHSQTEELQRKLKALKADRTLEKGLLYIQTMFKMSAQRGTWKAANRSGRLGKQQEKRYWICRGDRQVPSVNTIRAAAAKYTANITRKRLDELEGLLNNWAYKTGNLSCVETGYKNPLNSTENDNFDTAMRMEGLKVRNRNGTIQRQKEPVTLEENVEYNRYWYMYGVLSRHIQDAKHLIKEKVEKKLSKIPTKTTKAEITCVPNNTEKKPRAFCEKDIEKFGPSGNYPKPHICKTVSRKARTKVSNGIKQGIIKFADKYFDKAVRCSFQGNRKNGNNYPGIRIKPLATNKKPNNQSTKCENGKPNDNIAGWKHKCPTTWFHSFQVYLDGTVMCTDGKFTAVPGKETLKSIKWKVDTSFSTAPTAGKKVKTKCKKQGHHKKPLKLKKCKIEPSKPKMCYTEANVIGELEE